MNCQHWTEACTKAFNASHGGNASPWHWQLGLFLAILLSPLVIGLWMASGTAADTPAIGP